MKSFDCYKFAKKHKNLDSINLLIMAELAYHYDHCTYECMASLSDIAHGTRSSISTIDRRLKELEVEGYIKIERSTKSKSNFWIKGLTDSAPKTEAEKAKEEKFKQFFESFLSEYPSNSRPVKRSLIKRKFGAVVRSEKTYRLIMMDIRARNERNWDTANYRFIMDAQNYLAKEAWLDEAPAQEPEDELLEGRSEYVLNKIM